MINDLLEVFYPSTCFGCKSLLKKTEKEICINCHFKLSNTYHFKFERNELMQKFYGRLPLEFASSAFFFEKNSPIQEIIHELKYRNKSFLGEFFAKQIIDELKKTHQKLQFDFVVPVPLHFKKLKKRGYNQLDVFGKHIATHLDISYVNDMIIKTTNTLTQTQKSYDNRKKYNDKLFIFNQKYDITNKHILLIDDVVTTGTTLEECGKAIVENNQAKLSLTTMSLSI
jgi:ComF family protein